MHHHHDRHGAKQPERFNPERAAVLNDPARFDDVPLERILDELRPPHGSTVVDFGAGTGLYALALARQRPDLRIVALDEQPAMLQLLREAVARDGAASVEVADPSGVDALRGCAGSVLALNVLHELGDAALGELRSLLARDAPALFVDWNGDVDRPIGPPRDHVYGAAEAKRRLESAGFDVRARPQLRYHYVLAARARAA